MSVNKQYNQYFTDLRNSPITSYGIILFTVVEVNGRSEILYQLCQRRDSISYAEFLKNKLEPNVVDMHINLMSDAERERCIYYYARGDPESLWDDLWINHKSRIYKNDMQKCCDAFKINMKKHINKFLHPQGNRTENPWGFSKGRKLPAESDIDCAIREFQEETTIPSENIKMLNIQPYEELYKGTDDKQYKTVYYVAYISQKPVVQNKISINGIRRTYISEEVSQMEWCDYHRALEKLDVHKQKILKALNITLLFDKSRQPPQRCLSL
jgi:8-oxo-dGTP pyrophosphatase MutT (NUDIX family)